MNNKEFLIWFAGFMDGEGTWRIKKHGIPGRNKRIYYHIEMIVTNTHKKSIDYILKNLKIGAVRHRNPQNPRAKDQYIWHLASKDLVVELSKKLIPYLVTKKEIAKVVAKFPKMNHLNRWDHKIQKDNDRIYKIQHKLRQEALAINFKSNPRK